MSSRQNHFGIIFRSAITALLFSNIMCIQYTPIDLEELPDCAVIVTTPHEYTGHSLQSDFGSAVNCITYDAINQAYFDAIARIDVSPIAENPQPPAVAAIGQVLLDVSYQLAKQYNLNREDIELGLTRADTMKTVIRDICPAYLSSISCHAGKYRRHDGLCTNIEHPSWGATNTVFSRMIPPEFVDGISSPRRSINEEPLPSARLVSRTIHIDEGYHDHAGTTMLIAWGQFLDHDFSLMGMPVDPQNMNEPENCCDSPPELKNPFCFEIDVPKDDYFYHKFNIQCQDFVRSYSGIRPDCKLGSRAPFNTLTSVIDGNTVYGESEQMSRQLRAGQGGLLRMNSALAEFDLKDLLPPKTDIPDQGCIRTNVTQFCFMAGEGRVNEQLVLACIHILMAREHNRIAKELSDLNPHWEDEIIYEETRRIIIAEIQHITFNEFLPVVLGKDVMEKHGLLLNPKGFWDGYDSETNPGITDEFAAAAFRFGHSLLPSTIERWNRDHQFIASKRLSDLIRQPYDLYQAGVLDEYFIGLLNQVPQAMDYSVTQEVTNNLFKKPGNPFGLDLIASDIQRGRDFGLPGYMFYRDHCGLKTAYNFDEMIGMMPNSTIQRYKTIYQSPWDIDLWSGGAAEIPSRGSMVGPTFACIIASQMKLIRQGDRFWYELPNQPSSFTEEQLQEIKKIKLSRILCDNTDMIETVQIYTMVLPDLDINPRVPCESSILPSLDLSHWRETPVVDEVFTDNAQNHTTYAKTDVASVPNQTSKQPSAYEYHIKTVAIIGGSNPLITLKDLLNPSLTDSLPLYESHEDNHLRPRRSIPSDSSVISTNITTPKSKPADNIISSSSNHLDNTTSPSHNNSSSSPPSKDLTKRSFYPSHSLNHPIRPQSEMTQAIMEENQDPAEDHPSSSYHRRSFGPPSSSSISGDDEGQNIEEFFRKNVPIYDGVPAARRGYHHSGAVSPKKFYHFSPSLRDDEEEEEEDGKPMKGLLEVHPNADMEYEYVPMKINEFGKQIVMEDEAGADDEEADQPSFPYRPSSSFNSGGYSDDDSSFHGRPASPSVPSNHPYPFENSYSSPFESLSHNYHRNNYPSSSYSDGSPTKYGTSHQYNSFADQQPRYYKHFKPSIPYPAHDESDYSSPSYSSYSSPGHSRPAEYSGRGAHYNNHDFIPKRAPPTEIYGSFASKYPTRSTHVPQTLEEYHRIHGTFDTYKKSNPARPYSRPIIVPQDDEHKEEDEEEKDKDTADYTRGPKSFVSLNFGTTGTSGESDDEGVSVRHEIGHHFRPRRPYFRPAATTPATDDEEDHREFQVEYPAETISGSTKYRDDSSPSSIKAFVDSVFKQNKYDPDIVVGKKSNLVSPYNPHFGERVKQKASEQNILWHRKSLPEGRVARDKQSRDKNDRLVHEENIKMYDSLVKEVTMKPAKRDANTKDLTESSQESGQEETPSPVPQETQSNQDEVTVDDDDEDDPQLTYWSQSTSEPN